MSCAQEELFWALLERGKLDQLKRCTPKDFCWSILNPTNQTTILVTAINVGLGLSGKRQTDLLDTIEWMIRSGASFSQKCGKSDLFFGYLQTEPPVKVKHAGHSVLSYIKAFQTLFEDDMKKWKEEHDFLDTVVEVIAEASNQQTRSRASVDEGILDIWEKYLQATNSHDLSIQTLDGCVTCHAQLLMGASPVVQAMLGSPMKEGNGQKIHLGDTSSSAVQLFVEVLYTCSSQSDPVDWESALSALDLAHRWQVEAVVAILTDLLQELITEESFSAIAEQAALKGLEQLTQQCRKFGIENAMIQEQIKQGQLPKVVQKLFQADPPKATAAKKRKRL